MSVEATTPAGARKPPVFLNKFASFLLKSPLHGVFSKRLMLITFKGRKSGKLFTTPVGYQRDGNTLTLFTDNPWWRNLVAHPEVMVLLNGQTLAGRAEVIHGDVPTVKAALKAYMQRTPMIARAFNIELDAQKQPVEASLERVSAVVAFIQIHLL